MEGSSTDMECKSYKQGQKRKGKHKRAGKEYLGSDEDYPANSSSRNRADKTMNKSLKHQDNTVPQALVHRKQIDPDTTKYFSEIANAFEGGGVDLEERSFICGNALEETSGKELELATDYIISHTLQGLLEGCDLDHLCSFLRRCANDFPCIAMDKSGSHVAETALKSLAVHLQDKEAYSVIEETLTSICKAMIVNPVDVMCNCYGSHVLRSLLCLCKGVPLDSTGFHSTKSSTILAERLNVKAPQVTEVELSHRIDFPDLLKLVVLEILKHARKEMRTLQVDQYSSLVLQTAMKLFVGCDEELLHIIPVVLGCHEESLADGSFIGSGTVKDVRNLMKTTSFSHLMEVILEVAPETLFNEMFNKIFRKSLFEISSHFCGNFVVQALVSRASQAQIELIWEEIGTKFKDLLGMGRSGVVASLIAASQRLHLHEHKCCQALAAAVCSDNESAKGIVPRILFLDSYFGCEDPASWNWPNFAKVHVMGSLILQAVFRFRREFIGPYIASITSLEADHVLQAAKDAGGARVIEAFLESNASEKQKGRLVSRLRGHFGELAMHMSASFTVEKCFIASNMSKREAIVSELSVVRTELSRTWQGPHLLRALDVDRYDARPEEWKSRQASKQAIYRKFYAAFGSDGHKTSQRRAFVTDTSEGAMQQKKFKKMREDIDHSLASADEVSRAKSGASGHKKSSRSAEKTEKKRRRKA